MTKEIRKKKFFFPSPNSANKVRDLFCLISALPHPCQENPSIRWDPVKAGLFDSDFLFSFQRHEISEEREEEEGGRALWEGTGEHILVLQFGHCVNVNWVQLHGVAQESALLLGAWEKARGANDQEMTTSVGETLSGHKVSVQPNHWGSFY